MLFKPTHLLNPKILNFGDRIAIGIDQDFCLTNAES